MGRAGISSFRGTYHGILVALWPLLAKRVPLLADQGGWFGTVLRVGVTFVLMHIGWLMFREHSVAMLMHSLALNPFDAPASRVAHGRGAGYRGPVRRLAFDGAAAAVAKWGALISVDDERFKTWSWTLLQGAAAAACI